MTSTGSKTVGNHGSHAHSLAALDAEVARAKAAEAALADATAALIGEVAALLARIAALEAPPVPPPVVPPPAKYPPLTTLTARPIGAIPPLPALYQPVVIDGIRVTRITDTGVAPGYSKRRAISCQGGYLNLDYGRKLLDGRTYQPIPGTYSPPGNATWSRTQDHILYGTSDPAPFLYALDVRTNTRTNVHDFGRNVSLGAGEGALSDAGIAAIQDFAGNLCSIDTTTLVATPWFPSGGTLDNCTMSVDGRFIIGGFTTAGTGPGKGTWAWLRDGSGGRQLTTGVEHADAAVSSTGRQVWVAAPVGGVKMVVVDIETLAKTTILPAGSAFGAGHVARSEPGFVTLSTYAAPSAGTPGSDCVVDLYLDGSGRVRDYGPIFHRAPASDYARQSVGQSMGDGRMLVSSDWGTAGIYTFVLEVKP